MPARIVSLQIGRPKPFAAWNKTIESSFMRLVVEGPVMLREEGLEGDEVADKKQHGGPDKAICVYPMEHYAFWKRKLRTWLEPPAFGENFTTRGLKEPKVCIGDIYRVGEAVVQVTQPRPMCKKLAARHNEPMMARWMLKSGNCGFLMRCLEPGRVQAGNLIVLVERGVGGITIDEANRVMYKNRDDREAIRKALAEPALSQDWRYSLEHRR